MILFRRLDNPWQALREFVDRLPECERERLRRLAAMRLNRIDETHPPSYLRRQTLERLPAAQPQVRPDPETWDAVAQELNTGAVAATKRLRSILGAE